jgi:hypothetical protein
MHLGQSTKTIIHSHGTVLYPVHRHDLQGTSVRLFGQGLGQPSEKEQIPEVQYNKTVPSIHLTVP